MLILTEQEFDLLELPEVTFLNRKNKQTNKQKTREKKKKHTKKPTLVQPRILYEA